MIEDPRLAAHFVNDRLSHLPGELGLIHPGMSAEGDKVVASGCPRADFFLQNWNISGMGMVRVPSGTMVSTRLPVRLRLAAAWATISRTYPEIGQRSC